jgi:hypothetical protein
MSLQLAAQHLASKGRNGDSTLVHMTPGEVKGLQALAMAHGGSLTINPDTGLVEASFLKNLLPMIAGIGLNMMFPGLGALATAGIVGGGTAIATGDISKGLMAGLGAYGGAGIGKGLSTAGASAAGNIGVNATSTGLQNAGANALRESAGAALSTPIPGVSNVAGEALRAGAQAPVTMGNISAGIGQLGSEAGRSAAYKAMPFGTLPAAGSALTGAITPAQQINPITPEKSSGKYISEDFQAYVPAQPNPYYRPQGLGYEGYAEGGMIDPMQRMPNGGLAALQGMRDGYAPMTTMDGNIPQMADGGSIGGYSDGGRMLKGPGDGMSDSIPGVIGNKQPARLADGEFVVPADVVSHLGNGSTDAGAKRLYGMMDKVRKARTGNKKQGKQIKPEKYMPA